MSDPYSVVRGGLVVNDPGLPVFDLDVLDSYPVTEGQREEVQDLHQRITDLLLTRPHDRQLVHMAAECVQWLEDHPAV